MITRKNRKILLEKVEVQQRMEPGTTNADVALENNPSSSAVSHMKKHTKYYDLKLDKHVVQWINERKRLGLPISKTLICERAEIINRVLNGDPKFKASYGWLDEFRKRNEIKVFEEKRIVVARRDKHIVQWINERFRLGLPVNGPLICGQAEIINREMIGDPTFKATHRWLAGFKRRNNIKYFEEKKNIIADRDKLVVEWIDDRIRLGLPVNGPLIFKQAEIINREVKADPTFKATYGWLEGLKRKTYIKHFIEKKIIMVERDKYIVQWINERKRLGLPVTGPLICGQAEIINKEMKGNPTFKASDGWLDGFKKRNEIKFFEEKKSFFVERDKQIVQWINDRKRLGLPVNGPLIRAQAEIINKEMKGDSSFKATNSWVIGFKRRNGMLPKRKRKRSSD